MLCLTTPLARRAISTVDSERKNNKHSTLLRHRPPNGKSISLTLSRELTERLSFASGVPTKLFSSQQSLREFFHLIGKDKDSFPTALHCPLKAANSKGRSSSMTFCQLYHHLYGAQPRPDQLDISKAEKIIHSVTTL